MPSTNFNERLNVLIPIFRNSKVDIDSSDYGGRRWEWYSLLAQCFLMLLIYSCLLMVHNDKSVPAMFFLIVAISESISLWVHSFSGYHF